MVSCVTSLNVGVPRMRPGVDSTDERSRSARCANTSAPPSRGQAPLAARTRLRPRCDGRCCARTPCRYRPAQTIAVASAHTTRLRQVGCSAPSRGTASVIPAPPAPGMRRAPSATAGGGRGGRWSGRALPSILAPDPDHEFPRYRIPVLVAKRVDRGQVFVAHGVPDLRVKTGIGQGHRATFEGRATGVVG